MKKISYAIVTIIGILLFTGSGTFLPVGHSQGSEPTGNEIQGSAIQTKESKTPEIKNIKCVITGKIELKTEKVEGKEVKNLLVTVLACTGENGKSLTGMIGKMLKLTGPESKDAAKMAGKEVEITGTVKNDQKIEATSINEKTVYRK